MLSISYTPHGRGERPNPTLSASPFAMPELPEVETVRRGLERRVLGRTISAVQVEREEMTRGGAARFRSAIEGARVSGLRRKGKTLALELSFHDSSATPRAPACLLVRLGMTGQLVVLPSSAAVLPHTHVRFLLDGGPDELRYRDPRRFGLLRCCAMPEADKALARLGPDALEISLPEFEKMLAGRRGAIKSLLMNQGAIAGLGNIYADEALFEAKIHPETAAGRLAKSSRVSLHHAIQSVLQKAVRLQGTSFRDYIDIEGKPGAFAMELRAYGRAGEPCVRCGGRIRRIIVGGRSSHYCPKCQRRR